MKICQRCGKQYTDDNMFCENCGEKLVLIENPPVQQNSVQGAGMPIPPDFNPQKPKPPKQPNMLLIVLLIAVVVMIAVTAVLLFLFKDNLPFMGKDGGQQEFVQETMEGQDEENSKEQMTQEEEQPKEETDESAGNDAQESYADVQLNGVDNAYIQVSGVVMEEGNSYVLKLSEVLSACAYDPEDKVVEQERVSSLVLEGDDLEEYLGAQVLIKGRLSADISREFTLQVVNLDVEKAAVQEDYQTHRYELIVDDVTWLGAFEDCKARGGYLLQINSEEELEQVGSLIFQAKLQNIHFYLGGRRDLNGRDYFWVDSENRLVGGILNPEGFDWTADYWMENEPSYTSDDEEEMYMNLVYYQDEWMLNDVSMDITPFYPGRTGYICEYDE